MTKTLYSLGVIVSLLSFSYNASAHSGQEYSADMHSILHIIISISVSLALLVASFLLLKRAPKVIMQAIKQRVRK